MQHNYTDEEIIHAWNTTTWTEGDFPKRIRAFFAALPERPQAQTGQQEAIDAAIKSVARKMPSASLVADPDSYSVLWPKQESFRLAIAQAYDAARPQAAEITALKAERDRLAEHVAVLQERNVDMENQRDKLDAKLTEVVEAAEKAGWNGVENSKHLPTYIADLAEDLSKAQAALRQSTQSAQPAEIAALKAELEQTRLEYSELKRRLQVADERIEKAQAVAAVVLAQAVRRMEAVPAEEIARPYEAAAQFHASECGLEAVRARLIASAKGEAQPVVVNEPPQDERQPDLSGEGEKQAQPWTPVVGDVVQSIPEIALGGQMYWRDLALQLARVWWKCYKIGASLQHGDLDKDIAFSIVCERHGGRVFHGDTPENAWNKAEEWLLSPDRENFLTPAKP